MKKRTKITAVLTAAAMTLGAATLAGCGEETAGVAVSVESVDVDENGNLIVRFSDGTTKNAGTVDGKDGKDGDNGENGKDGISVRDVYVDGNGDLIVLLSDGTKRNAGNVKQPESVFLNKAATFDTGYSDPDGGVAEIVRYNADNGKIYLVNGKTRTLDVVSLGVYPESDGELETKFDEEADRIFFDELAEEHPEDFGSGFVVGDVTSVAVNTDLDVVAVALQHSEYDRAGAIALLNYDGSYLKAYPCGVQPDMITFDGTLVLTADEGEPRAGYGEGATDPEGSVTVLDLSAGVGNGTVSVVTFGQFDDSRESLTEAGVLIKKGAAPSKDFEPEYIATDGARAYVSLQEANAIAVLDLQSKTFEGVYPLGFKDHSVEGNGLDLLDDGIAKIETQNVYGVYMPDGIDAFSVNGETYLATANEGDAREWGDYSGVTPTVIGGTKVETLNTAEWDGADPDKTYVLGGRSFSIFRASDMSLVYDSGDAIERAVADSDYADYFNCSNDKTTLDSRSKKKGPEPETILVRKIGGRIYAFVGLERVGGVVTFDVTNFLYGEVDCKNYSTTRDYSQAMAGDVAPEGMDFVYASEAVGGKNLLIVANENSGTVAFYAFESFEAEYDMHAEFKAGQAQAADHPVIFSVYGSGGKTDGTVSHNYIAIKNPTDEAIDLSGYALRYTADASAADGWQEFALSGSIAAGEIYIVRGQAANTTSAVLAIGENDFRAEWSDLSVDNKAYSVQLVRDGNVVDAFGMSDGTTTEVGEGVLASDCSKQKIVVRKNDADTDDNATDFEVVSLKDLSADSETVLECLRKLGLTA